MNNIMNEYREVIRNVYGDKVADSLEIDVKDGWYHVNFRELPAGDTLFNAQQTRLRKTQLQATIANLKLRSSS